MKLLCGFQSQLSFLQLNNNYVSADSLFNLNSLYTSYPQRTNTDTIHPDAFLLFQDVMSLYCASYTERFNMRHLWIIYTTYRRSVLNHLSFESYLRIYDQQLTLVCDIFSNLPIDYILFNDTPHHLEQVLLLSAANEKRIACYALSGTFSYDMCFLHRIDATRGVFNIIKTSEILQAFTLNHTPQLFNYMISNSLSYVKKCYGSKALPDPPPTTYTKKRLNNYLHFGIASLEYKRFQLCAFYRELCSQIILTNTSKPTHVLMTLHYEPEAVVDNFCFFPFDQIEHAIKLAMILKPLGLQLFVKEHPKTFRECFLNHEQHIPMLRTAADYVRLVSAGIQLIDDRYNLHELLLSGTILFTASTASTVLYESVCLGVPIYPLGLTVYEHLGNIIELSCPPSSSYSSCIYGYTVLQVRRPSEFAKYIFARAYMRSSNGDFPIDLDSNWLNGVDTMISAS